MTWAVKDTGGAIALVKADKWEVDGNCLAFFCEKEKVACFVRWAAFWETTKVTYLPAALTEQRTLPC